MTIEADKLQGDLSKIMQTLAVQDTVLNSITGQLTQSAVLQAQQGAQITTLTISIEVMKHESIGQARRIEVLEISGKEDKREGRKFGQWLVTTLIPILLFLLNAVILYLLARPK